MSVFSRFFSRSNSTDQFTQPIYIDGNSQDSYLNGLINVFTANDSKLEHWVTSNNNEFEIYDTTPEVRTPIDKGALMMSNGSWKLIDAKTGEEIENHPLLDLVKKPNSFQDKNLFLQGVYTSYSLYGNNFSYLNYALKTSEIPKTITNLNTNQIRLDRTNTYIKQVALSNIIKSYKLIDLNDKKKVLDTFDLKDIVHLKNYNAKDPLIGLSVLKSLHMPISNIRAARGYVNADYTKKGALGALSPEQVKDGGGVLPVDAKKVLDLEKQYSEATHGSADNKSKVIIAKMPIKYVPFGSAIKDHMIHEEIDLNFKRIIDALGLDTSLFGFEKQSTFNNQKDGEVKSYQNGIIPVAKLFTSALNDSLQTVERFGAYLKLDYSHLSCFQANETSEANELLAKAEAMAKLIEIGYTLIEAEAMAKLKD